MKSEHGKAIIALGSNLAHDGLSDGALLLKALDEVASSGMPARSLSNVWRSAPWPPGDATAGQEGYTNAIAICDAGALSPPEIIALLQRVERRFGRERRVRWEARTLDLDLIDLGGMVGNFDGILLPHPRAHERGFVLAPLAEVAPDWRHPVLGKTAAEMLAGLTVDPSLRRVGPPQAVIPGEA